MSESEFRRRSPILRIPQGRYRYLLLLRSGDDLRIVRVAGPLAREARTDHNWRTQGEALCYTRDWVQIWLPPLLNPLLPFPLYHCKL